MCVLVRILMMDIYKEDLFKNLMEIMIIKNQ